MHATVHQNTTNKQSNGTSSADWNKPEVNSEQEHKEAPYLGKPTKPSAAGSAGDKPTQPTLIPFDFSRISIFPTQQARIQPKLTINAPGDRYEQEADRVAEQVMRMPEPVVARKPQLPTLPNSFAIQRKCDTCANEEEENLQAKSAGNTGGIVAPEIAQQIQNSRGGGQPMDLGTRSFMEAGFGTDFGGVRIHTDNNATLFNQRLQAKAFTLGSDVYFNQGQYSPGGGDGRRLLAHELTHVVQQGIGGHHQFIQRASATICNRPNTQVSGFPDPYINQINADLGDLTNGLTIGWSRQTRETRALPNSFPMTPGAGLCTTCCNDVNSSRRKGSLCTPKGNSSINRYACQLGNTSWAKNPSYFEGSPSRSEIAIHSGPKGYVASVPASHGCIRTTLEASAIIHDNSKKGTPVNVHGNWNGNRCYPSENGTIRTRTQSERCGQSTGRRTEVSELGDETTALATAAPTNLEEDLAGPA